MMRAVGLNIFGGGFTLGVQRHFSVMAQMEECGAGARTWALNFDELEMEHPMTHGAWPLDRYKRIRGVREPLGLVYANPPCAPWSSVNTRSTGSGRFSDPRLALSAHSMEAGIILEPEVFICESVPNAYTIGLAYYNEWARKWIDAGYMVTYYLTDALLHGVPSTRQRFHFIAHRHELVLPEHDMRRFMPTTLRAAVGDLEHVGGGRLNGHDPEVARPDLRMCFEATEPGDCVAPVVREMRDCGLYSGTLFSFLIRRQLWDAPAFTVLYMEAMVHPNGTRWMTLREGLRTCGYPDSFRIHASKEATQAVLPPVGEALALIARQTINEGLSGQRRWSAGVQVVDERGLAGPYRPGKIREALRAEL